MGDIERLTEVRSSMNSDLRSLPPKILLAEKESDREYAYEEFAAIMRVAYL